MPPVAVNSDTAIININVRNYGNIDISNAQVLLFANNIRIGSLNSAIKHDSSKTYSFEWVVSCGNNTFSAIVDSTNTFSELSESNNSASIEQMFCIYNPDYKLITEAIPNMQFIGKPVKIKVASKPVAKKGFCNFYF